MQSNSVTPHHNRLFFEYHLGPAVFLAKQKVLAQLAEDLLNGLNPTLSFKQKTVVFCGIHNNYHVNYYRRGYKIGIQTEQFFNHEGQKLWRYETFLPKVMRHLKRFDTIIDINSSNRPAYCHLPRQLQDKIIFGPHIFPVAPPEFSPAQTNSLAFVGDTTGRRSEILDRLAGKGEAEVIKEQLYGQDLIKKLGQYSGLLNIHYDRGVYTESPRLLTALNAGKPVVSEPLSREFIAGEHYIPLGEDITSTKLEAVYENFRSYVSEALSFQQILLQLELALLNSAKPT